MPTRKQRRRREKGRRHEYEYVYVDDEGREVEVEEDEAPAPTGAPAAKGAKPAAKAPSKSKARAAQAAGIRPVPPPSWRRVFRRAAIFVPIFGLVVWFLLRDSASTQQVVFQVVVLTVIFMPFSYFLDGIMYRQYRKKIGDPVPSRERGPRKPSDQ